MYLLVSAALLLLVLGALIDIITRADGQVKHLPKLVWVLLVVFLPVIGSILWFAIGREYPAPTDRGRRADPRRRERPDPRPDGPGAGRARSTEEQLAALDQEIDAHNNAARIHRLEAELERRRKLPE